MDSVKADVLPPIASDELLPPTRESSSHASSAATTEQPATLADAQAALIEACELGHGARMRELLEQQDDVLANVHTNEAALRTVCAHGYASLARDLLALDGERQINVNADGQVALRRACWGGHTEVVRVLLALTGERQLNVHMGLEDAFRGACWMGHVATLRLLLSLDGDRRVDVHASQDEGLLGACLEGHWAVVRELASLTGDRQVDLLADESSALRALCERGHDVCLIELLDLPPERGGLKWDTPQQHDLLRDCLRDGIQSHPCVAVALLQHVPLPPTWPRMLLRLCRPAAEAAPAWLTDVPELPQHLALAQRVLLHILQGGESSEQVRCVDTHDQLQKRKSAHALALCGAVSGAVFALIASAVPPDFTTFGCFTPLVPLLAQHRRHAGWHGQGAMAVLPAPGSSVPLGGEHTTLRIARRVVVLCRAATKL